MLAKLNREFGIPGSVSIVEGPADQPLVVLRTKDGHQIEVALFGGQILSWQLPNRHNFLFMSERADLSGKRAIRGGIPIVFPQFNAGKLPSHGFARITPWELIETSAFNDGKSVYLKIRLTDSEASRAMWPHSFEFIMEVHLTDVLRQTITIKNTGTDPLLYQNAFHTYFNVKDISRCSVQGLKGSQFIDQLKSGEKGTEDRAEIVINCEVDRIYQNAPSLLTIFDEPNIVHIRVRSEGMRDAVLWNPWVERSKALTDLSTQDYQRFLCLEFGNIASPITLAPGTSSTALHELSYW